MRKIALGLVCALTACSFAFVGCGGEKEALQVYMPDGAPALALGLPMYENNDSDGVEYHVVSAQTIQTYVTGNQPQADVCVLPVNLAAKLLGSGGTYRMAGVVTHGNMYFLAEGDSVYAKENLSDLVGKTVGVVQLSNVPGLTLKIALDENGVPYNDLSGGGAARADTVNLKPVSPSGLIGADVYLVPSPEADKHVENTALRFVGDLQAVYGNGYPQAVIVVKNSVLENRAEWVESLLDQIDRNTEWLGAAQKSTIADSVAAHLSEGLTPKFTAESLTDGAIAHSGVWFQYLNAQTVAEVSGFLQKMAEIDPEKAAVPSSGFYWMS